MKKTIPFGLFSDLNFGIIWFLFELYVFTCKASIFIYLFAFFIYLIFVADNSQLGENDAIGSSHEIMSKNCSHQEKLLFFDSNNSIKSQVITFMVPLAKFMIAICEIPILFIILIRFSLEKSYKIHILGERTRFMKVISNMINNLSISYNKKIIIIMVLLEITKMMYILIFLMI
ncbi:hypothetical protein TRFO_13349 [Tritrichomonas foetus]|uniref:Uncharacterized protein n=1 Tax=Tritrichomonas foetus TaxID=1144522 RepID=A0A1J4KY64_9EUKA|nr:hypothetical protein TRFO_13349 [Tritrichomonas foetus]|eukprot:OHT16195.1 hypothetical protein TRFO_13349 [Tritrichomonas foetus]